jgi:uncharacterized protein (TIGR03435 family)
MRCALTALTMVVAGLAFAQSNAPEFEVASVKVSRLAGLLENHTPTLNAEPGRDIHFENIQLRDLIMLAYGVGIRQISAPLWLYDPAGERNESPRFDIIAKIPADAKKEQLPLMLQQLLADRFKLQIHSERKEMQTFALEVVKGGPKIQESEPSDRREPGCARSMRTQPELTIIADCHRMTMPDLAQQLATLAPSYFREGPIVDKTGIAGMYDFHLEWIRVEEANAGAGGDTMFAAVQKYGLRLEKQKDSVEILVVDHCEKEPTEN